MKSSDISIAMIVRNEAPRLAACLASLWPVAAEICVVDTGSTDETVALAEAAGCRVGFFPWCNDFAAARNASLALCIHPWILVMDADEQLAAADYPALHVLTESSPECCYRFITRNYTNNDRLTDFQPCRDSEDMTKGYSGWFPSGKVRLFPNRPEIIFEGAVHELVNPRIEQLGIPILDTAIPIYHYPLDRGLAAHQEKQRLYLELGKRKITEDPENAKAHAELGAQWAELGEYAAAAAAYREAIRRCPANNEWLAELGGMLFLANHREEARKALEIVVARAPEYMAAWRNLGVLHSHEGRWHEARRCFEEALRLAPDHANLRECLRIAEERLSTAE